jgi:hypothetical protein
MPDTFLNLDHAAWSSLRARFPSVAVPASARLRYAVVARWLSILDRPIRHVSEFRQSELPELVVIAGHWRSGTSLLHELLCSLPEFGFASTFACFNPHAFAATRGRAVKQSDRSARRPMDAMLVRRDLPQEDEFGLLCLGAPSPYEAFLFPQAMANAVERCDPNTWTAAELACWQDAFRRFICSCALAFPGKPLVLKSPPHSLRISLIRRMAPDTRIITIVRDPRHVLASTQRMWREMWKLYALSRPPSEDLSPDVISGMIKLDSVLESELEALPSGTSIRLRYEDLTRAPERELERLLSFLKLRAEFPEGLRHKLREIRENGANRPALSEVDTVSGGLRPLIEKYGY